VLNFHTNGAFKSGYQRLSIVSVSRQNRCSALPEMKMAGFSPPFGSWISKRATRNAASAAALEVVALTGYFSCPSGEQANSRSFSIEVAATLDPSLQEKYIYPARIVASATVRNFYRAPNSLRSTADLPACSTNVRKAADAVVYEGLTMIGKDRSHIGRHQS
jgi:hypothetical protein